jgi:hypothetical protein
MVQSAVVGVFLSVLRENLGVLSVEALVLTAEVAEGFSPGTRRTAPLLFLILNQHQVGG